MKNLILITTADGSHSLRREDLDETYHSHRGARAESAYVFIGQGFDAVSTSGQPLKILEIGLGTGLNVFLTLLHSRERCSVDFHTLEPHPVPEDIYTRFNYATEPREASLLLQIHRADWGNAISLEEHFTLTKYRLPLEEFSSSLLFDLIYFDAFAPAKQPEVWSVANLHKCYHLLRTGGILVTYCAQGQFKRNLVDVGFEVEVLPGALGKKEMVRARKS